MAGERVMLSKMLTHHVELHRGLGFKFRTQHGLLRSFVSFAEAHGDTFVHVDRVLEWARQAPSSPQRRNRLVTVRRFAWRCTPRTPSTKSRQRTRWDARCFAAACRISTRRTRSPG